MNYYRVIIMLVIALLKIRKIKGIVVFWSGAWGGGGGGGGGSVWGVTSFIWHNMAVRAE